MQINWLTVFLAALLFPLIAWIVVVCFVPLIQTYRQALDPEKMNGQKMSLTGRIFLACIATWFAVLIVAWLGSRIIHYGLSGLIGLVLGASFWYWHTYMRKKKID